MKKFAFSIALLALASNLYAQKNIIADLNGEWKFSKGDDKKWAGNKTNVQSWESVILPSDNWEEGYYGYGWFRKNITLPEKKAYYFNLGQADDDCEVYFNGKLLKLYVSNRPGNDSADSTNPGNQWKKYRSYYIPAKLVQTKNNSIAIRVWNTGGGQGGIRYGKIFVSNTVFYNQLPIGLHGDWITTDGSNEWLISFYNNKVAYRGQMWNYGGIREENGKINIVLLGDKEVENIVVKAMPDKSTYMIGTDISDLQLCSLTETFKETYLQSLAKTTIRNQQNNQTTEKAHFSGYIKDYAAANTTQGWLELYGLKNKPQGQRIPVLPDGTFSTDIETTEPATVSLRVQGFEEIRASIAPGKNTFLAIDPEEFKIRVTDEYYNRERLTLFMGDLAIENKLSKYMSWLNELANSDKKVWDKFIYTAEQYNAGVHSNDKTNEVARFIVDNYLKYDDTEALKKAKIWSAKALIASPENHAYNSTFNAILQKLGEHLEGLEYLVKALNLAEKDKNEDFVRSYKQQIKEYVADIIK